MSLITANQSRYHQCIPIVLIKFNNYDIATLIIVTIERCKKMKKVHQSLSFVSAFGWQVYAPVVHVSLPVSRPCCLMGPVTRRNITSLR